MFDSLNNVKYENAIAPVSVADTTAQASGWIDRAGFQSLTFAIAIGALHAASAFAVTLQEADASDQSDAAAVADSDMLSMTPGTAPLTAASFAAADASSTKKVGYIGQKRYLKLTVTPTANAGASLFGVVAALSRAANRPV